MKIKITRNKIIAVVVILCVLVAAWFFGSNYAGNTELSDSSSIPKNQKEQIMEPKKTVRAIEGQSTKTNDTSSTAQAQGQTAKNETAPQASPANSSKETISSPTVSTDSKASKDQYLTDPIPSGKPKPVESQKADITEKAYSCTLLVVCTTILDNRDKFNKDKLEVLPEDGVIFPATTVTFYEGESVFNALQREMKKASIHMEFEATPIYNSNYIEGIHNLYEFDCGELSGWMYKVNGWFPNYGCSRYMLKDGDVVEWIYTCDLGRDIGGGMEDVGGEK